MNNWFDTLSSIDITQLKRKKLWVMIVLSVSLVILMVMLGRPKHRSFVKKNEPHLIQIKANRDDFQHWARSYDSEIDALKKNKKTVSDALEQASLKLQKLSTQIARQDRSYNDLLARFNRVSHSIKTQLPPRKIIKTLAIKQHYPVLATSTPTPLGNGVKSIASTRAVNLADKTYRGWLPVGSFFTATLLNGIDAGTGMHAQANPQPVLMRINSQAFLPNQARYRVHACFVLGSAYGSLPSQRALVRTARISCVSEDGSAIIDTALKGYVVDLDGKIGLRGTLINRQGAKLAKAMLAGFFSGLSNVASQLKQVVTRDVDKAASTITPRSSLQLAGISGADNATKELMHFYINEAKRLFPVIEVNAGREVVINVSEGVSLTWTRRGAHE